MPYSNQLAGCVDIADGDPVRIKSRGCNARGCGPWSESRTIQLSLGGR